MRYVVATSKRTLASTRVEVTAISGTIDAPESVPAGSEFKVEWTGPSNKGDYLTIVPAGAEEGSYKDYAYTQHGSPSELTAPDDLGAYEVRYVIASSKRTLVSQPITLTEVSANLSVPGPIIPGGTIRVEWDGPDGPADYITVVEKGADEGSYMDYAYTQHGSPAEINLPKALGVFEVRYVIGKSKRTLASVPITLKPVSATVTPPATTKAGEAIEVNWTGPAAKGDTIEIVAAGAEDGASPLAKAGTVQGSPLFIYAPEEAGEYEVRYKVKDTGKVLAKAPLSVE